MSALLTIRINSDDAAALLAEFKDEYDAEQFPLPVLNALAEIDAALDWHSSTGGQRSYNDKGAAAS